MVSIQSGHYLCIGGSEKAAIKAANALLQRHLEDEHWLLLLVKAIHFQATCVSPNHHFIGAIFGEVNARVYGLDRTCTAVPGSIRQLK